jgi:hypothetical protein
MCVERDGSTHREVQNELLVGLAEEVRVRGVEPVAIDNALEAVCRVFVQTVELLAVEGLEQRGLHMRTHWQSVLCRRAHPRRENPRCSHQALLPLRGIEQLCTATKTKEERAERKNKKEGERKVAIE